AEPPRQVRRGRREQAHAEDRDRAEEAGDRVRDVQVALDRRNERPDPDELRTQRERREEEAGEEREPRRLQRGLWSHWWGSDARKASQARTQGASISNLDMGATEDDAWRSFAAAQSPPDAAGDSSNV